MSHLLFGVNVFLHFLRFTATTITTMIITTNRRNTATPTDTPTAMARTLSSLSVATPPEGPTMGLVGELAESVEVGMGAGVGVGVGALYTGK